MANIDIADPVIEILELIVDCQDQRLISRGRDRGGSPPDMDRLAMLSYCARAVEKGGTGKLPMQIDHADVDGPLQLHVPLSGIGRSQEVHAVIQSEESL